MTGPETDRRKKREATTSTILDAAEKLFSERGYGDVSVRDIGQEAGVSHALVHRYLGSKREIYRAVLRRSENLIRDAAGDTDDLDRALSLMIRAGLKERQQYLRLIVHSAASGLPFEATIGRFPATDRLVEVARRRMGDAHGTDELWLRFVIAATVCCYVGWIAMEPWIVPATGLPDLDEDTVADWLEKIMLGIVDQQLPRGDA